MDNNSSQNKLMLTQMISVDILQQLQDAFADIAGVAALTTDSSGVPVTNGSNFTDFCTKYIRPSELGRQRCGECDKMGAQMTIGKGRACAYYCHAGLVDFAAPIIANGEMIGSFIGGQVLPAPPDIEKFEGIADELGIDRDELIDAVKKVKVVKKDFIDKAANCLSVIASVLSNIAYNGYRLYQSNIEIEKTAKAKSDFLANMSHEIRTPMNAVLGMADLALREDMSPAARDYIHQIKFSGQNLLVIINDILDFSKIESGKMDIVPVTYETLSVTNDLASTVCTRIGDKDIRFIMDIAPDIPEKLYGDNVRIQQILVNILNNAVKFTNRGRVLLKMEFEHEDDDIVMLKAEISDTGRGIKSEDLGKLFKSFQQVDSRRNRNIEGTGLGLAITKQLIDLMGGKITVESEYGVGTTFRFNIPQKMIRGALCEPLREPISVGLMIECSYVKEQIINDLDWVNAEHEDIEQGSDLSGFAHIIVERPLFTEELARQCAGKTELIIIDKFDSVDREEREGVHTVREPVYFLNLYAALGIINKYERRSDNDTESFNFTAPEANVLIVDDNPTNLIVARGLIEPLKMQVDTAASAMEALDCAAKKRYDIVFMDHMMPEIDGIEATHLIRTRLPSYNEIPIIALTANVLDGTREMFMREGMNDFVGKPIDIKDITSKIRKWLPERKVIRSDKAAEAPDDTNDPVLSIKELDVYGAVALLGSKKLFCTVLKDYYSNISKKHALIEKYWHEKQWHDYTIEVHSLKSTSRQIGAAELSELAAELEKAGNEENAAFIDEKTPELLERYRGYGELLAPYFPEGEQSEKKRATDADILEFLDELNAALDDFDTLAIDEAVERMAAFEYDEEQTALLESLKKAAEDCETEECAVIADKWRAMIS